MNKILILLTTISIAFGQNLITGTITVFSEPTIEYEIFLIQPITFGNFSQYGEGCYDYSNYVGDRYMFPVEFIRIEEIYESTTPTLEGFIEW